MGFIENVKSIFLALILLVIISTFLGGTGIGPDLEGELNNTAAHPNGPLTITIIGFVVVALGLGVLFLAFDTGRGGAEGLRRGLRGE